MILCDNNECHVAYPICRVGSVSVIDKLAQHSDSIIEISQNRECIVQSEIILKVVLRLYHLNTCTLRDY